MHVFRDVSEISAVVGTSLGYSDWYEVTQAEIDRFADASGDHQWIHVDPERAALGPFGSTIAHGYFTLSLTTQLAWQVYSIEGMASINYGSNKVRFPAPVRCGARIRARIDALALEPVKAGHQFTTRVTVECADVEKAACVAEIVTLLIASE